MEIISIIGHKTFKLNCYLFEPKQKAKGVIQIIHGMQEHAKRYIEFASFLCENGYVVLASDLRGHGNSLADNKVLGHDPEYNLFDSVVKDQIIIYNFLKEKYNLPVYIFGHSFGSFISQKLMQGLIDSNKFILCGTSDGSRAQYKFGNMVASLLCLFNQQDKSAKVIENLSLKAYGKKFENGNWLTRDNSVFKKYSEDPLSGTSFPISFYKSLFSNFSKINKGIDLINENTEILLIVGSKDPVGNNAKDILSLHKKLTKKNKKASYKLYEDARHELINEICKDQVYNDILNFYNS